MMTNGPAPYGYGSSEPDEIVALQSDVMRFMAILGLCLMIIFALVQSLPQNTAISQATATPDKPVSVPEQSQALQKENEALIEERDILYTELDRLQGELTRLDSKAAGKKAVKTRTEQPDSTVAETPPQAVAQKLPDNPVPATASEPEGFTLRFQSTGALEYLVRKGSIQLLVQVDKEFNAQKNRKNTLIFITTAAPVRFHEMEANTVPVRYKRLLAGSGIKVKQGQERTWEVILPPAIQRQISRNIAGHKGGELRIDRRGEVSYHASRWL